MCEYVWTDKATKSGRPYSVLNDNPDFVVFHEYGHGDYLAIAGKRSAKYPDPEQAKALVEGIYDQMTLPKDQRWLAV